MGSETTTKASDDESLKIAYNLFEPKFSVDITDPGLMDATACSFCNPNESTLDKPFGRMFADA